MHAVSSSQRLERFIAELHAALKESHTNAAVPSVERRLLGTVVDACGARVSAKFLSRLGDRLARAGLYSEPPLSASGLRRDDWILFSTGPFPPDSMLFARERDLQRFVEACLGTGVFRDLRPYRVGRRDASREFRLPSGQRVDLLCEEKDRAGEGALVAIELKRERQRGTVDQMVGYLRELSQMFPSRTIRGLIITGREDQVGAAMRDGALGYQIDWYCYQVSFQKLQGGRT